MGRKRPGGHCWNRDIVNVDNELFSPAYDFEGDSGGAWWEYMALSRDSAAMCGSGFCMGGDIKRWQDATNRYFDRDFKPQLKKTKQVIETYSGGAPPSIEQQELLNQGTKLIKDWDDFQMKDPPWAWRPNAIVGHIKSIVQYFDQAACLMDDFNNLADEMGASHMANRAPILEPKLPPDGGSWIRGGGTDEGGGGGGESKGIGMIGWVAIGAAGYFGFKVLTE